MLRVVALVAYAVSGCPCGCAWLVRLRGFSCVCVALFVGAARVCLSVRALLCAWRVVLRLSLPRAVADDYC